MNKELHNLTSDAEGEEMLTVSRKRVQDAYLNCDRYFCFEGMLEDLFGSKCLLDENKECSNPSVVNCKHKHGDGTCSLGNMCCHKSPKPAELRYHKGDKVLYRGKLKVVMSEMFPNRYYHIALPNGQSPLCKHESDLEPYTEPQPATDCSNLNKESSTCTDDCSCQDHFVVNNEMVDRIIKDSFSKERRLNIAAKMMQALVCAPLIPGENHNPPAEQLAQTAFRLADALIAEAEKGGSHEKA